MIRSSARTTTMSLLLASVSILIVQTSATALPSDDGVSTPAVSTRTEPNRDGQPDSPSEIEVTRVILSTGGLAQVEGEMAESDDALTLSIERPQIADVLRTLVLTGNASVVSVDLEAAEPVGERSPVGRLLAGDLSDPATVLESLIGEVVELTGGSITIAGTLLAFDDVRIPAVGEGDDRPGLRVAVATPEGQVAYATFPTLDAIAIEGEAADERVQRLVPAVGRNVDDGRRDLTVRLATDARAGFLFVVPTTVWRPSYRAILSQDGSARLQGWATLENTTGLDWTGIELGLSVGTPVAYRQDVYSPLRTTRPDAPFEVGQTARTEIVPSAPALRSRSMEVLSEAADMAPAAPSPVSREAAVAAAPSPLQLGEPAQAGTATSVFAVAGRIDLAAGRTLSVPFLDASNEVSRIAYLDLNQPGNGGSGALRPLDALEVDFTDDVSVPGGLVAVYDARGFVGDARFAGADEGDTAILPFALTADLDSTAIENTSQTLASASLADGTLILRRELRTVTVLAIESADVVTLVADGSHGPGARLAVDGSEGVQGEFVPLGPNRYRLRAELPEGTSEMSVTRRRTLSERYLVSDLPSPVIEEVLSLGDELDPATRDALTRVAAATERIADLDRRIGVAEAEIADLREATRIDRENLDAIDVRTPEGAQVRQRIVERSNELDAALGTLRDLRGSRLEAENELRDVL